MQKRLLLFSIYNFLKIEGRVGRVAEQLQQFYMDLHIHIGRTNKGRPVKITASKDMTLSAVIHEAVNRKGLNIIGIIDAQSPEVLGEFKELVEVGILKELPNGGLKYHNELTIIPGAEIEIYDDNCQGPIHVLCFFPMIEMMEHFSNWCSMRMKNIHLSSQRIYTDGRELQRKVKELSGLFIPAHVFTPFKSLYGKGVLLSLSEVFLPECIDAIELGLSADTEMAVLLPELNEYPFLTNSDAHSSRKIGREHQLISLMQPDFLEIKHALEQIDGRKISKNVGLHPRLGKYYQTVCSSCLTSDLGLKCSCGHGNLIKGVMERITELSHLQRSMLEWTRPTRQRPPYLHQVPLEFLPGVGPKTLDRLIESFQTEMAVLHLVSREDLLAVVPEKIAMQIMEIREGRFTVETGGGGKFGKIK